MNAIGVDIGGTRTKYGLVNTTTGEVMHVFVEPTEKENAERFLHQVGVAIRQFNNIAAQSGGKIEGIGFGVPGFINDQQRVETTYGFLTFMENYPLKTIIEDGHGMRCILDNDARTVSLGEALYGRGKGYNRVLTLTLGTGVGFGFVVNGQFTEQLPLAHMGGHMKITNEGGECYCGKTGCLEALVSSTGILQLAKDTNFNGELSVKNIFEEALKGDSAAALVVENVTNYLHTAIHNYINLFAPDMIVFGGGIAKSLAPYLEKIKGKRYLSPYPGYQFQLAASQLEETAGILGSAALLQTSNHQ